MSETEEFSVQDDLRELKRNRGSVKTKLTLFEKFANSIKNLPRDKWPSYNEIELRYNNNSSLLLEFDNVQTIIESRCPDDQLEIQYLQREEFSNRFFTVLSYLRQILADLQTNNMPTNVRSINGNNLPHNSGADTLQNVLLPKIKLPVFSGEFHNWINFKNNFTSTICNNLSLTDSQKFQFLKASLEGYASHFIEGLDGIENPFERAWDNLCNRFDKKQFLLDSHFKSLLSMQSIQKENYGQFRKMLDEISKHLIALDGVQVTKDVLYDSFIIHILSTKLDKSTIREWKEHKFEEDLPSLEQFIDFLKNKSDILQCLDETQFSKSGFQHSVNSNKFFNKNNAQVHLAVNKICNFCKKMHSIYKCPDFISLSVDQRILEVRKLKLCENCLLTGHDKNNCKYRPCPICKIHKHNSMLHKHSQKGSNQTNSADTVSTQALVNLVNDCHSQVLLSTIICNVLDNQGNVHTCRALLDSGAQINLITDNFCNKLKIPLVSTNCSIIGIGQSSSNVNQKCTIDIHSRINDFNARISCLVVPVITGDIPSFPINISHLKIPNSIKLSDFNYESPRDVDILLGANIFWELILDEKIKLGQNLPTLVNTKFGWILTGTIPLNINKFLCNFGKINIPEDEQLKKFWEIEDTQGTNQFLSQKDTICESIFERDTFRNQNGQFVVKFPLKQSYELLGDSKISAMKRFRSLENKFSDDRFKHLYFDFIHEYEELGHMSKIQDISTFAYFLPHHGVLKETSITTKLRTVFDGSCPTSTGWSLNDIQYIGPKVQNDILDILLRFRTYSFVVSADVSKMYRCILMHPDHRPLQQIIWRENPNEDFSIYQLNTVTYGTRAAPYLAIKCIRKLAQENSDKFPVASKTILDDMYVDDLLTGSNDLGELKTRCLDIFKILASAQFVLRKWVSNDPEVVSEFAKSEISNSVLDIGDQESCKTLGIQWINHSDRLKYTIKHFSNNVPITKRYILSIISQIYDPLGLLSPSIILAKILIQKLWSLHIPWDDPVTSDIKKRWLHFQVTLSSLNDLSLTRKVISNSLKDIHCFCDASESAYATCIYLRSEDETGKFKVELLCSKTKVAPLKTITIPKLELCACLLGVQLIKTVVNALNIDAPIFMWSDSQVALSWIHTEPSQLQVFVANRVSKIQSFSYPSQWRYVNTSENPADVASRGIMPDKLVSSILWWKGPKFLYSSSSEWPNNNFLLPKSELTELRKLPKIVTISIENSLNLITKFSDFKKLHCVTSYCLRFINNIKNKTQRKTGSLQVSELDNALMVLIKQVQSEAFANELTILRKNKFLPNKNKFSSLTPFIDDKGVIRVGGRLKNTYLAYSTKHPILLPSNHHFTKLIFEYKHRQLLHPGPQSLLSSIRQFYWPVGGRILAKQTVKNCVTCFKHNPVAFISPMSNLPNHRIKPNLPFEITGIDYAGPIFILSRKGRGAKLLKCYLAIFICFCTKAIHIEIVTDLTTDNFLLCLKRFTSRRGIPIAIYSDNGSTFVGANNKLKELGHFLVKNHNSISDLTNQFRIQWKFIPPYTPNHGGLWEAAVKNTKYHLKRILLNKNVTFEELNTLVIQIEGILNSRPLFALSSDPNDIFPITPSHFLIGRPITSIPDSNLINLPTCRLSRIQHVQQLYQQFWRQFSKKYISQLHQQYKWKGAPSEIKINTLVLIKSDIQPPCKWPIGRIVKLFPGKDEICRTAEVKTSKGITVRSVRHLCPLPLQDDTLH